MAVLPHGVSQCVASCCVATENLEFAPAIIVEPLDAPLAACDAILEYLGWFRHGRVLPMPG
jgi:hypothetical protein